MSIQNHGAEGHDSAEDALTALELALLKVEWTMLDRSYSSGIEHSEQVDKGPSFGIPTRSPQLEFESLFDVLEREFPDMKVRASGIRPSHLYNRPWTVGEYVRNSVWL